MLTFNIKNKILILTILFIAIFSFSNKALADYSVSIVNQSSTSVSLKAGGIPAGTTNTSLHVFNDSANGNTTYFHGGNSDPTNPDANGFIYATITGLTPNTKYKAELDYPSVANTAIYDTLAHINFTTDIGADSSECGLYTGDPSNPTAYVPSVMVQKYWFRPTYNPVWQGPFDTLSACQTAKTNYFSVPIGGSATVAQGSSTVYIPLASVTSDEGNCTAPDANGNVTCSVDTTSKGGGFGVYFNFLIKLFIGICAVLSMLMIVYGGIEYMTGEAMSEKADGKGKIIAALMGLLLAVGAYAILNTINPALLDLGLSSVNNTKISGSSNPSTGGEGTTGNCHPTILPANTAGNEILATVNGAHSTSCFCGAITAWAAAGYAPQAGHSAGCPSSVTPGDILVIHNDNNIDVNGNHSVIFDSINSDGSWRVRGTTGTACMSVKTPAYTNDYMTNAIQYSYQPQKCTDANHDGRIDADDINLTPNSSTCK